MLEGGGGDEGIWRADPRLSPDSPRALGDRAVDGKLVEGPEDQLDCPLVRVASRLGSAPVHVREQVLP